MRPTTAGSEKNSWGDRHDAKSSKSSEELLGSSSGGGILRSAVERSKYAFPHSNGIRLSEQFAPRTSEDVAGPAVKSLANAVANRMAHTVGRMVVYMVG